MGYNPNNPNNVCQAPACRYFAQGFCRNNPCPFTHEVAHARDRLLFRGNNFSMPILAYIACGVRVNAGCEGYAHAKARSPAPRLAPYHLDNSNTIPHP
jgi:hypothetical protein